MSGELLLGVDIGTSSTKGVLARPGGEVVATAQREHGLSMPRPGWAEHDAEGVWWADFVSVCRELLEKADGRVAAVCTSGIGACLLPADAAGNPLRPAILYGIDTRAEAEIEELTRRYGAQAILERCGSPLSSQAVGPKLLWLRRNEPGVWERTAKVFMASSFLVWRLTGEYVLDHHSASQCDPLYDLREYRWIGEWAGEVAPGLPLPRLLWPAEVAGEVTPEAAEETGLPAGTPVAAGTIDAWSEGASVGVQEPGDLMLMYGTTMFIIEVVREPLHHPGLWGTTGILPNTRNLAAGMATSGALTGWLREISGGLPYERLTAEAAAVPPGSGGLVVLPYFAGERTPLFDPRARGLIGGLTLRHGRGHLYRAVLEATAYGVRHIFESMQEAGGGGERLVAVGGGTKGGLWTRIVSDVTGRPQQLPEQTIGAAYGDALLAARAVGLAGRDEDWCTIADTVEPDEGNREVYDELYRVYRELYPATREQMHRLADMQREGSSG
ncbi:carbohydrate kinase, FGGY [Rubrobacter xylanophilus DSM 9941]|uniref:Carbohydrate kinase, FGGY n=1 Tax=Rubrobacter xylanophilus (strain DSM 9941 / JCM 11954 / NBRC 16129 / PRD-1) TaxID=266117 RepID=Q1AXS7_RUBXD|nr:FGGY-family carbohydrate kinase [Rubrobacter xylanophilus]ABG03801.1 carbohydrate kinase, FGGY [Rubrobacter xylanophilus DSM 9941]